LHDASRGWGLFLFSIVPSLRVIQRIERCGTNVTPFLESQARGYERLDSRTAEHRDIRSPERRKTKGATIVEGNIHWRGLSVLKRLPLGAGGVNRIDKRLWRLLLGGDPASADAQISNTESKFMS